jgi:hypothetical protein
MVSVPPTGNKVKAWGAPGYNFRTLSAPLMAHLVDIITLSSSRGSFVPQTNNAGGS